MRSTTTITTVAAGLLFALLPTTARADHEGRLVRNWYARYLHRDADACGLANWAKQLRCGIPAEQVEASILGSEEYYHSHGCSPEGYVAGLYEDVLGRRPCRREVGEWVARFGRCGCRIALAKEFLCAARRELEGPAPVVYVPDLGPAVGGVVRVRPMPMVEPPGPSVSLRVRIGRSPR